MKVEEKNLGRTVRKRRDSMDHNVLMLSQLKPDESGRIVGIEGGRGLRQKLFLKGLFEDSVIRVISCYGPVTVEVDRSMVSMGRGVAQKVMVEKM